MQCTQELAVAKSQLSNVHCNYEKLKVRFHKLHTDYHKLMSIARVLTTALEDSVKGIAIDFQIMLETCIKIFPDLFNQNIKDSSHVSNKNSIYVYNIILIFVHNYIKFLLYILFIHIIFYNFIVFLGIFIR